MTVKKDRNLDKLSTRMREEWDRRISHDYRYWMSDGVDSDELMWKTGKRDLELLLEGIDHASLKDLTMLDLGCGVGRLLGPAADLCDHITGVDVSEKAIEQARRLTSNKSNVTLHLGSGADLSNISDNSIDIAYSFAAIASMPVKVTAAYLLELQRVLKPGALARLQLYLGSPQHSVEQDTIAIRCFDKGRFVAAVQAAGFAIESIKDLILPFEVSDQENGLFAKVVALKKFEQPSLSDVQLVNILCPGGEERVKDGWKGSETEYLMALARAFQHLEAGDREQAREALEFAVSHYGKPEPDVLELLEELRGSKSPSAAADAGGEGLSVSAPSSGALYDKNVHIIAKRFPAVAKALQAATDSERVVVDASSSGVPVIRLGSVFLDQKGKPRRAGEVWADRTLNSTAVQKADTLVVVGFAGGFHLASLIEKCEKSIHVVEPDIDVLRKSLELADHSQILERITSLSTTLEQFKENSVTSSLADGSAAVVTHAQTHALHRDFVDEVRTVFWSDRSLNGLRPSIAVVGPIYGGSLPIARYVSDALQGMGHRVQYYDLSHFCDPYKSLPNYVRDKARLSNLEGTYVKMLSEIVLEGLAERPVDILISLAQAPLSPEALSEIRERGTITAMWFVEDCRRFTTWQHISRYYDYMFIIQKDPFPALVEAAGAGRAIYLPLACAPEIHRPLELDAEERERYGAPISFLGAGYNNRQQMFAQLAARPFKIWGTEWPTGYPFDRLVQEGGRRLSPDEYVKIFNATAVNLNLHSSKERDGVEPHGDFVNPRTFELAAAGAFQLCDERELLPELFEAGSEIITFRDQTELESKIDYYLAQPEERQRVAAAARERVLRDHTYERRMTQLLGYIFADKSEYLRQRINQGPWPTALEAAKRVPELHKRFEEVYDRGAEPTLEQLVANIQMGSGALDELEQKLMFLFNLKAQIAYVKKLRNESR